MKDTIEEFSMLMERIPWTIVKPDYSIVINDSRIKGDIFSHRAAVRISDNPIIFLFSVRDIADSHADRLSVTACAFLSGHAVVEIESAVITLHHIRGIQILQPVAV